VVTFDGLSMAKDAFRAQSVLY